MSKTLPRLDNFHIDRFFEEKIGNKHYIKCLTKDELGKLSAKRMFSIINSQDSDTKSFEDAHWTMVYTLDDNYGIIFDSMGADPNEDTLKFMRKCAKKYDQEIIMNDSHYQKFNTNSCAWYCIFIILHLLEGYTYKQILGIFKENNLKQNEKYLYDYFKNDITYMTEEPI